MLPIGEKTICRKQERVQPKISLTCDEVEMLTSEAGLYSPIDSYCGLDTDAFRLVRHKQHKTTTTMRTTAPMIPQTTPRVTACDNMLGSPT